jgi:hypothetical protein
VGVQRWLWMVGVSESSSESDSESDDALSSSLLASDSASESGVVSSWPARIQVEIVPESEETARTREHGENVACVSVEVYVPSVEEDGS